MRKQSDNESLNESPAAQRVGRGRAVLTGYGLDDAGGHVRYTRMDGMNLYGGSEKAHDELRRRAACIQNEAVRLGISLDSMTYGEYLVMRDVVDRVNRGSPL